VRDHLIFKPHAGEGGDARHLEGFLTLSAVAAVTSKVRLGTAMAICHRHPIHLAQTCAGLSAIAAGRVILGLGLGGFPHEFGAVGRPTAIADRAELARENIEICRALWRGDKLSHRGKYFEFNEVELRPRPRAAIPIWIGGSTPAACRRAVTLGEGWMPARINFPTFIKRQEYLRGLCQEVGRPLVESAVMPFTTIGKTVDDALSGIDIKTLLDEAHNASTWVKPPSGKFETWEDLGGVILAGSPADIVRESRTYENAGANHIVYDLRLRFTDWYEQIDLLGREVLPALRG
jgi:alkanesulfonate monooxygenase SsuD/methylene tetrahydromethanopterin reductase-like flavin-dependent oxidoreductase (luciferase family)